VGYNELGIYASSGLLTIPIFFLTQHTFIQGMTFSGLKG
jgi:hypothetical protein